MTAAPTASIIIATYNRPRALSYAIQSVLHSSFQDWELIIVGDGCTEETGELIASFPDPRIRYVNLPKNTGGQSVPNSTGIELSRGKYLLFLNHDDMYFADHISQSIEYIEKTNADFIFCPIIAFTKCGKESGPPDPEVDAFMLAGVVGRGFDPRIFIIASCWTVRRETCLALGPWALAKETRISPSQEWIFRAWRKGFRVVFHPHISVFCIHAGLRRLSYLSLGPEHERVWSWIKGQASVSANILDLIAVRQAMRLYDFDQGRTEDLPAGRFKRMRNRAIDLVRHIGFHPVALRRLIDGVGKGTLIALSHAKTGTPALLKDGDFVRIGEAAGDQFVAFGWHWGEGNGRWTSAAAAELAFRVRPSDGPMTAVLTGHPLRIPDEVWFVLNGKRVLQHRYTREQEAVEFAIPAGASSILLAIQVRSPTTPHALGKTPPDMRTLGFFLNSMRLIKRPDNAASP